MQRLFLLFFAIVILAGCTTPPLKMDKMSTIKRGLSPAEVHQILQRKPEQEAVVILFNASFKGQSHDMQTGTRTESSIACHQ